jgi:hypothetical protein
LILHTEYEDNVQSLFSFCWVMSWQYVITRSLDHTQIRIFSINNCNITSLKNSIKYNSVILVPIEKSANMPLGKDLCFEEGVDYISIKDLETHANFSDARVCQIMCAYTQECRYWTWIKLQNGTLCKLKSVYTKRKVKTRFRFKFQIKLLQLMHAV